MAFPTNTIIPVISHSLIFFFFCQSFWVWFFHLAAALIPSLQEIRCPKVPLAGLFPHHVWPTVCTAETLNNWHIEGKWKRLMQEQEHTQDVHCSSLDTELCQDPGIRARFYIPREDPLCFSQPALPIPEIAFRNVWFHHIYILRNIYIFKKFPNVTENIHTDLVNWHFTISKWASIPPLATYSVYFLLCHCFSPLLETESQ